MNQPIPAADDFGPEDFHGWPEVPTTEQLERAIEHVRLNYETLEAAGKLTAEGDQTLERDLHLCARSMYNSTLAERISPLKLLQFANDGQLITLADILAEEETDLSFAAAILDDDTPPEPGHRTLVGIDSIFGLLREPGWMGLSLHLAKLKDRHVHALESPRGEPGRVECFIAVPSSMMTPDVPPPGPVSDGEAARLRDIAVWHGALSFHWIRSAR